jgi:putative ABC transport system permease protein
MHSFLQDFRFSVRLLRKSPGFAAVAIITLALGIGANTAIFTVVNSLLLQPLPYPDANRLVFLNETFKSFPDVSLSYADFRDWESQNRVFSAMGATQPQSYVLTGGEQPLLLEGRNVSAGFFATLGVTPAAGRAFLAPDDKPGADPVAMISYKLWQERFGGSQQAVGTALTLDQKSYTVIGVLPRDFDYRNGQNDVFVPIGQTLTAEQLVDRNAHNGTYSIARLKPGVTLQQARAEMSAIASRLGQQYPQTNQGVGCQVTVLQDSIMGDTRPWLLILLAAVGLVLLIACANMANLLLARASSREKEVSIRTALGAGRWRLVRQVLTESVLLALCGGSLGVLLASMGVNALIKAAPDSLPRMHAIQVDSQVLLFTALISCFSGVLFGLAPALHTSRFRGALNDGVRSTAGPNRQGLRNVLVIAELAVSVLLLIGAGLLVRSFSRLLQVNPGLNSQDLLTATIHLPENRYKTAAQVSGFFRDLQRELLSSPGIRAAASNTPLPFSSNEFDTGFLLEGSPQPRQGEMAEVFTHYIDSNYLGTMEIPLLQGRNFTDADTTSTPPLILVNRSFAARNFPNANPLGKRVRFGGYQDITGRETAKNPWYTIAGVIGDVKQYGLNAGNDAEVFFAFNQISDPKYSASHRSVVLRFASGPSQAIEQLRQAVHQLDKDQPLSEVATMESLISASVAPRRTSMFLLATFAALAVLLAAVGIYGVLSFWVTQRTREIGIRMALGASRKEVMTMVGRQTFAMVAVGLIVGLLAAYALARFLASQLFGVSAHDAVTFVAVPVMVLAAACLSCVLPVRRATLVDPIIALRHE